MTQRGVSPVVGMVVLVGLVAVVSVSLLVVGASVADSTRDAAQTDQVESSMSQFAETADAVATGGTSAGEFQVGSASADGSGWTDGDAGQIEIVLSRNATGETTLVNSSLGAYRYQLQDGTEIAYQAGGVWRLDGDYPSMVRPPEFEYRASPAPTLTFPHVRVTGDAAGSGSIQGELSVADERSEYPINDSLSNPIEGEYLTVAIESRYCEGWERHVDQRTDAAFDERCGNDGRLIANMTVGDLDGADPNSSSGAIDGAVVGRSVDTNDWNANGYVNGNITYSRNITDTNGSDIDDVIVNGTEQEVDDELFAFDRVESRLNELVSEGDDEDSWKAFNSSRNYAGSNIHYVEEITIANETLDIDARNDAQTIVVNGSMNISSQDALLDVSGTKDVRIYVDGSVKLDGSPDTVPSGNPSDPSNLTIVANDGFKLTGNTALHGVVIALSGEAVVESADTAIEGALVGKKARIETANVTFAADGWQFADGSSGDSGSGSDGYEGDLYYLHVSETVLDADA